MLAMAGEERKTVLIAVERHTLVAGGWVVVEKQHSLDKGQTS